MEFHRKTLPEQHYIYVDREAEMTGEAIAAAMESGFGEVFALVGSAGITPQSMPIAVYVEMPGAGQKMAFRTGFFVSEDDAGKASGGVKAATIPAGEAMMTVHTGPYDTLNETHEALWTAMEGKGGMPVWEVYVDDPGEVPEAEVKTEVWRVVG